jgi:hypothetical protein
MAPKITREERDATLIQAILEGLISAGIPAFRGEVFRNSVMAPLPGGYQVTLIDIKDRRVHFPSNYYKGDQVTSWSGVAKTYSEKRVQLIVSTATTRYERLLQAYQA